MSKYARTYLAFTIGPEINTDANQIIYCRVGALIEKRREEGAEGIYDETDFNAAVRY